MLTFTSMFQSGCFSIDGCPITPIVLEGFIGVVQPLVSSFDEVAQALKLLLQVLNRCAAGQDAVDAPSVGVVDAQASQPAFFLFDKVAVRIAVDTLPVDGCGCLLVRHAFKVAMGVVVVFDGHILIAGEGLGGDSALCIVVLAIRSVEQR